MVSTARRGLCSVCGGEGARCASGCSWGLFWEPAFLPPLSLTAPLGRDGGVPVPPRSTWGICGRFGSPGGGLFLPPTPLGVVLLSGGFGGGPGALLPRGLASRARGAQVSRDAAAGAAAVWKSPPRVGLRGPGRERWPSLWEWAILSLCSASSLAVGRVNQKRRLKVEK